jgi:hypothetical protein
MRYGREPAAASGKPGKRPTHQWVATRMVANARRGTVSSRRPGRRWAVALVAPRLVQPADSARALCADGFER